MYQFHRDNVKVRSLNLSYILHKGADVSLTETRECYNLGRVSISLSVA